MGIKLKTNNSSITLTAPIVPIGGGTITDVKVDGLSVVTNGIANISLSNLEKTLQDILTIIQGGELDELTISKIEELIVSYFENKTIEEVER